MIIEVLYLEGENDGNQVLKGKNVAKIFENHCSRELSVHLMERKLQSFRELAAIAEQYLTAHNKKLSSRDFNLKKSASASGPASRNTDTSFATTRGLSHFIHNFNRKDIIYPR